MFTQWWVEELGPVKTEFKNCEPQKSAPVPRVGEARRDLSLAG